MRDEDSDKPDLPWTILVDGLDKSGKVYENSTVDLVIVHYLKSGDTRPLAWFLRQGHTPGPGLLIHISDMLAPGRAPEDKLPFELVAKSRTPKRGRPPKGPEQKLRDYLTFLMVRNLIEQGGPGTYDAAINEVAAMDGLEISTVKRAYERFKKALNLS